VILPANPVIYDNFKCQKMVLQADFGLDLSLAHLSRKMNPWSHSPRKLYDESSGMDNRQKSNMYITCMYIYMYMYIYIYVCIYYVSIYYVSIYYVYIYMMLIQ
jgi:hypothetical protein